MSKSRFKVFGKFDGTAEATVTIDRGAGLISVRPLRRRREYTLPLADVAETVMWRIIKAEANAKLLAKKAARKARGR